MVTYLKERERAIKKETDNNRYDRRPKRERERERERERDLKSRSHVEPVIIGAHV